MNDGAPGDRFLPGHRSRGTRRDASGPLTPTMCGRKWFFCPHVTDMRKSRAFTRKTGLMRRLALVAFGFGLVSISACGGEAAQAPAKRTSVFATIGSASPKTTPGAAASKPALREDASLLPRSLLFANPDRAMPLLSHDGKRISYLSNVDGVLNVWVARTSRTAKI